MSIMEISYQPKPDTGEKGEFTIRSVGTDEHRMVVNGAILDDTKVYIHRKGTLPKGVTVGSWADVEKLSQGRLAELFEHFIELESREVWIADDVETLSFIRFDDEDGYSFEMYVSMNANEWKRPYTFGELHAAVEAVDSSLTPLQCGELEADETGPYFRLGWIAPAPPEATLLEAMRAVEEWAGAVVNEADHHLTQSPGSLLHVFRFPVGVETACVQYLSYFVQFLRDLGIDADSQISREAGRVLFTVTPQNEAEALDHIREALALYLELPVAPMPAASSPGHDVVAVSQLNANIAFLQSQLMLASATIEAKDATIAALRLVRDITPKDADGSTEPLIGDIVSVTKYERGGVVFDLPQLLRRLKRRD